MTNLAARVKRVPHGCVWEITTACNLRCIHCHTTGGRRADDELTTGEVKRLLDQLAEVREFRMVAYSTNVDASTHVALVLGDPDPELPTLVRVHSECMTGDLFHSLRCDCGEQLQAALKMIDAAGQGVLLYMRQEGRGIGLMIVLAGIVALVESKLDGKPRRKSRTASRAGPLNSRRRRPHVTGMPRSLRIAYRMCPRIISWNTVHGSIGSPCSVWHIRSVSCGSEASNGSTSKPPPGAPVRGSIQRPASGTCS